MIQIDVSILFYQMTILLLTHLHKQYRNLQFSSFDQKENINNHDYGRIIGFSWKKWCTGRYTITIYISCSTICWIWHRTTKRGGRTWFTSHIFECLVSNTHNGEVSDGTCKAIFRVVLVVNKCLIFYYWHDYNHKNTEIKGNTCIDADSKIINVIFKIIATNDPDDC